MDAATVTGSGPAATVTAPRVPDSSSELPARPRAQPRSLHRPALAVLLVATFVLRVWGVKQGLPYSYNIDEATHFVPRAISFFWHDLNPHYFLNPPAYTYLLHAVFELWFRSAGAVTRTYTSNPTEIFVIARVLAAVLGTLAVWLTYLAGARFFDRTIALLAAAIFGLAFLPIFYSHLALNDVPTLAPVALALYGTAGVMRAGRWRDYLLAGAGVGLAAATKYTGGITLVCLLAAFGCDGARRSVWPAARRCGAALGIALVAFLLANPYAALDFSAFISGLGAQASLAAGQDPVKLGTTPGSGIAYYLWTFTWGLGWVPSLAALGGAALLVARRRLGPALVLLPAPVAFIIFMGDQQRYFGRWLMPIFPLVAMLGAYGAVELVRWLTVHGPAIRGLTAERFPTLLAGAVTAGALLVQSVVAVVHNDAVLSRPDTRNLARSWMVAHVPAGAKVVIEPLVPGDWAMDVGRSLSVTPTGERWWRYPTWLTNLGSDGKPLPDGRRRYVLVDQYERNLYPGLINQYTANGYCWVLIGSLQAGRALAQPRDAPGAIAYYRELARRGRLVYQISPFSSHDRPMPFNFDWSIDYYPSQYRLPGPQLAVYRLRGGRCA